MMLMMSGRARTSPPRTILRHNPGETGLSFGALTSVIQPDGLPPFIRTSPRFTWSVGVNWLKAGIAIDMASRGLSSIEPSLARV